MPGGPAPLPLAPTLDQFAALAAIRGDASQTTLYARAAARARAQGIESDADLEPFLALAHPIADDLDRELYARLECIGQTGAWVLLESAIADLPADLRWLFESGAVTIEQLGALHKAVGVLTAADLADAVERQAVRAVPGLDAAAERLIGAALVDLRAAVPRIPLGRAVAVVDPILARLRGSPDIQWAEPAGSLRRGQDSVGDVEIVAAATDPSRAIEELSHVPGIARILHRSERRLYLVFDRIQVGLRFPEPETAGAALLYLTGSHPHFNALRASAREGGGRLTPEGYQPAGASTLVAATEEQIYAALDLQFVPPEIRDGGREIEAARSGTLPALVSRADIRGDLHMHSGWSDGRDSIHAMAAACQALGYQYLAITDHSPHSAASHNLSVRDVERQADDIAQAREQFPDLTILHGIEVDILPDARLDLPDRVLERLDIVLASLHERAGQSRDQLLRRYLAAARHPLVNVITHPSNRLLPHRDGYNLDYDRLFDAAVESGTMVEIDGSPMHLDMDGALARRAASRSVAIAIGSDSHCTEHLERHMRLGVATARRGWVEPRHVVNTRSIDEIRAIVARKRGDRR